MEIFIRCPLLEVFFGVDAISKVYGQREIARIVFGNSPTRATYEQESRRVAEELRGEFGNSFAVQVVEGKTGLHTGVCAGDGVLAYLRKYVEKRASNTHPPQLIVYPPTDDSQLGKVVSELSEKLRIAEEDKTGLQARNTALAAQYEGVRTRGISLRETSQALQLRVNSLETYVKEFEGRPQRYAGFSLSASSGILAEVLAQNTQQYLEKQEAAVVAVLCDIALALEQRVVVGNDTLDIVEARKLIQNRDEYLKTAGTGSLNLLLEKNKADIQRGWNVAARKVEAYKAKNAEPLKLVVWLAKSNDDAVVALPCVPNSQAPVPKAFYGMLEELAAAHTAQLPGEKGEIGDKYKVHIVTLKLTGVSDYERFKQDVIQRIQPLAEKINAGISYLSTDYFPDISGYEISSKVPTQAAQTGAGDKKEGNSPNQHFMKAVKNRIAELGYEGLSDFCKNNHTCGDLKVTPQFFYNHSHEWTPTTTTMKKLANVLQLTVEDVRAMFPS